MADIFWADSVARQIIALHRGGVITLETGITPSGPYHVGHLREMIITDAVRRALTRLGAKTRFVYFVDDLDNLRKLYPFLPKSFEEHVGKPISQIPSPDGSSQTYADYYLAPFRRALKELGIEVDILYAHDYYASGKMTEVIDRALEHRDTLAEILSRVSGRTISSDWQPFEPLDETTGKIRGNKIIEVDVNNHRVKYVASDNTEKWADYAKGQGKLPWRVDWPARWSLLNVAFEPFGKEHAAAGGSYDVGREIVTKVYGGKPPIYEVYEHIYLAGEAKKMSASLGNLVSIEDFLQVVPPAVARYFILRSKNERHLVFDPGKGLMHLTDEFARLEAKVEAGQADAVEKSILAYSQTSARRATFEVPFSHLVNVMQAAQGNAREIKRLLERSGHGTAHAQADDLKIQIDKVKKWLELYAPPEYKFSVAQEPPPHKISDKEKEVLAEAQKATEEGKEGQELHNAIYESGKAAGLTPRETFQVFYRIFLSQDSGPKLGFFLSMLDRDFVLNRLKHYLT